MAPGKINPYLETKYKSVIYELLISAVSELY